MSNRFTFKQDLIKSTEDYFQTIDTSGMIGEVADEFSKVIAEATGISSAACKGFFWKCVKHWQGENETDINTIFSELSSDERNKEMASIMIDFEDQMTKVVSDPEEAMEFKSILADAFKDFKSNYKFTHFITPSENKSGGSNPASMPSNPTRMSSNPKVSSNPTRMSSNPSSKMSSNPSSKMSSDPKFEGKSMEEIRKEAEERAKQVLEGRDDNKKRN